MNEFYVYLLCYPITELPFYVGKGKGNRAWKHSKFVKSNGCNSFKYNVIRKINEQGLEPIIKIIDSNLSEQIAFELEMFMIDMLGRRNNNTGMLTNMTDGGEGVSGYKHSEESKQRISEANKGKIISEESKQRMRKPRSEAGRLAIRQAKQNSTYVVSDETRKNMSIARKGKPSGRKGKVNSAESNLKRSLTLKGRAVEMVECPHCLSTISKHTSKLFHFDNCKDNPNYDDSLAYVVPKLHCEHCGIFAAKQIFDRHHGKNCKSNPNTDEIEVFKFKITTCPHCGTEGGGSNMKRYHFDNCKELVR